MSDRWRAVSFGLGVMLVLAFASLICLSGIIFPVWSIAGRDAWDAMIAFAKLFAPALIVFVFWLVLICASLDFSIAEPSKGDLLRLIDLKRTGCLDWRRIGGKHGPTRPKRLVSSLSPSPESGACSTGYCNRGVALREGTE